MTRFALVAFAGLFVSTANAATIVVNDATDVPVPPAGNTTLRQALQMAASGDSIAFSSIVFTTPTTIAIAAPLPPLGGGVSINGGGNVILDGTNAGPADGLSIVGNNNAIDGMAITNFGGSGISVDGTLNNIGSILGNEVYDNDLSGIVVGVQGGAIDNNVIENNLVGATSVPAMTVAGNCQLPFGACAGILVHPLQVGAMGTMTISGNTVVDTQGNPALSQGTGIHISLGLNHQVTSNLVGVIVDGQTILSAGNNGHGVAFTSQAVPGVVTSFVRYNTIGNNGRSGVLLGQGSYATTVQDNDIGVLDLPTTYPAIGNGRSGVSVFGSDGNHILDNVIGANARSGIKMGGAVAGNWHSDSVIQGNLIGLAHDGVTLRGNARYGIYSAGNEGLHLIGGENPGEGNVISASGRNGVFLADPVQTVQGNLIGTDDSGFYAKPNGTAGAYPAVHLRGHEILFGGIADFSLLPTLGASNLVSGNTNDGIRIAADSGIRVLGNVIGPAVDGFNALGNGGAGVYVSGGHDHTIGQTGSGNIIADNSGHGINLSPAAGEAVDWVVMRANLIGHGYGEVDLGNGGDGIFIDLSAGGTADHPQITENRIWFNNGTGMTVNDNRTVLVSQNSISENGTCAMSFTGLADVPPPIIKYRNDQSVGGWLEPVPFGMGVEAVEVFWDADNEASIFLGEADLDFGFSPVLWGLQFDVERIPITGRISATVRWTDDTTSPIAAYCLDGCSDNSDSTCDDANPCTNDICDLVGGCTVASFDDGAVCIDGDPCTTDDTCLAGDCVPGPVDPVCPAPSCSECDPQAGGCIRNDCGESATPCLSTVCDDATGQCDPVTPLKLCDDGNDCTFDICNPFDDPLNGLIAGECLHFDRAADWACEEGDVCTGLGMCDGAGNCAGGHTRPCSGTDCTPGTCDPVLGCTYSSNGTCNDGFCDADELCATGCPDDCPDDDGDGLPNDWEEFGIDTDCDGNIDVYPVEFNGDRDVPNILLHLEFMEDIDHTHEPLLGVITELEQDAFLYRGSINLHVDVAETPVAHSDVLTFGPGPIGICAGLTWQSLYEIKDARFPGWKRPLFHFAVMAHLEQTCLSGRSGVAEASTASDDFMVSLGHPQWTDDYPAGYRYELQRNTIMHELGHTLALKHGGNEDTAHKVNYQSVMSYRYQTGGLWEFTDVYPFIGMNVADYSHELLPQLNDTGLIEANGVGAQDPEFKYWATRHCLVNSPRCTNPEPGDLFCTLGEPPTGWADWDCDTFNDGLVSLPYDISARNYGVTDGHDDWGSLDYGFQCNTATFTDGGAAGAANPTDELDLTTVADPELYLPVIPVPVDIAPGCAENTLPIGGSVTVAVYGSIDMDIGDLDVLSINLSGATPTQDFETDVNGDGYMDWVMRFDEQAMGDEMAVGYPPIDVLQLSGRTTDGSPIIGFDSVERAIDSDSDRDQISNACDLCAKTYGGKETVDGCP